MDREEGGGNLVDQFWVGSDWKVREDIACRLRGVVVLGERQLRSSESQRLEAGALNGERWLEPWHNASVSGDMVPNAHETIDWLRKT
jgi:hypothetical protein